MSQMTMATMQKEYVESKGTKCPHCGSDMLNNGPCEYRELDHVYQQVSCLDCKAVWYNAYRLVGFETAPHADPVEQTERNLSDTSYRANLTSEQGPGGF